MYQGQKVKSKASYTVGEYASGQIYIKTCVEWGVKRGSFLHYQSRFGSIENPSRFKAWAKKYDIFDGRAESILALMKERPTGRIGERNV